MLQGLTGYCSMPGMTAVAVAPRESALRVWVCVCPGWCELVFLYGLAGLVESLGWKGVVWKKGTEKGVGKQQSRHRLTGSICCFGTGGGVRVVLCCVLLCWCCFLPLHFPGRQSPQAEISSVGAILGLDQDPVCALAGLNAGETDRQTD